MKKCQLFFILTAALHLSLICQTEGFAEGKSSKIYYRTFGNGTPLLIINGGPGMNSNGFEAPAILLSKHHRTIIYDQRGTGRSSIDGTPSSAITMDLMIDDIERLRIHLQIDRWSVLGHSFGGMLASYYASLRPERIKSLILSSSGGIDLGLLAYARNSILSRLSSSEQDSVRYWDEQIENGDTSYHARYRRGLSLAPAYTVRRQNVPRLAERLTQGDRGINNIVWEDLRKIEFNCAPKLSSFRRPVLIIQGKQDIIKEETASRAHSVLPNSTVVLLDSCGHYGWLDSEKEYIVSIERFLSGID